jgi:hypothetical protein
LVWLQQCKRGCLPVSVRTLAPLTCSRLDLLPSSWIDPGTHELVCPQLVMPQGSRYAELALSFKAGCCRSGDIPHCQRHSAAGPQAPGCHAQESSGSFLSRACCSRQFTYRNAQRSWLRQAARSCVTDRCMWQHNVRPVRRFLGVTPKSTVGLVCDETAAGDSLLTGTHREPVFDRFHIPGSPAGVGEGFTVRPDVGSWV